MNSQIKHLRQYLLPMNTFKYQLIDKKINYENDIYIGKEITEKYFC